MSDSFNPLMPTDKLPFSLTTDSLTAWLDTLASLSPANAANQLDQTLKQLRKNKSEAASLLPLYLTLTPPSLLLANSLSPLKLADADHKLNSKSIKVAKLVIQMLRQLASGFCMLAESRKLDQAQSQQAIYYAVQLLGYCQRSYHLLYEMPSPSLWKQNAALYSLAIETRSLTHPQTPKLPEFKSQPTILAALKRNILFSLLTPTRYTAPEIVHLFQLANQQYDALDLSDQQGGDFKFYWNLEGEEPCTVKHISRHLPSGFLAIHCRRLVEALQRHDIATPLNLTTQAKLALHLSGYEQLFNAVLTGSSAVYQLLTGFNPVCHFFREQDKLAKIMTLGGGKSQVRRMGLIPLESEKGLFETRQDSITSKIPSEKVNLMRTMSNDYGIMQSRALDYCTGDIVVLYKEHHPPVLAVIRQLLLHELSGDTHALLEYVHGTCSIFAFRSDSGDNVHALVVGGETAEPEAYLPSNKYSVDSEIALNVGIILHLNACLESNASFARFKVRLIDAA